jgi:hypothetical protein
MLGAFLVLPIGASGSPTALAHPAAPEQGKRFVYLPITLFRDRPHPEPEPTPGPSPTAGTARLLLNEVRFLADDGVVHFVELTNAGTGPATLDGISFTTITETYRLPP